MSVITGDDEDNMAQLYKGSINQPCSACSGGDWKMEHHDHDYVDAVNRIVSGGVAQQVNAAIADVRHCIDRGEGFKPCHVYLDSSGRCQCGRGPGLNERRMR